MLAECSGVAAGGRILAADVKRQIEPLTLRASPREHTAKWTHASIVFSRE